MLTGLCGSETRAPLDSLINMLYCLVRQTDDGEAKLLSAEEATLDCFSESEVECCLKHSMRDGHDAVVYGSRVAGRTLGQKRLGQVARVKVGLRQLGRIMPEIIGALVLNVTETVTNIFSEAGLDKDIDDDVLELAMVKLLRRVENVYVSLGMTHFSQECKIAYPCEENMYKFNHLHVGGKGRRSPCVAIQAHLAAPYHFRHTLRIWLGSFSAFWS